MIRISIRLIIVFLLFLAPLWGGSQDLPSGGRELEVRQFSKSKLESLRLDEEMIYETQTVGRIGLLEKLKQTVGQFFSWLIRHVTLPDGSPPVKIIFYAILAFIMIYALLRLLKVDMRGIFRASEGGKVDYLIEEENIHEMDFNALVEEAISNREYRKAIRFIYLFSLKKLSDKHLINWTPGKTNHEYVYEIENADIRDPFDRLSYYYEYAWYGDFEIGENHFQKIRDLFSTFKERIR